MTSNIPGFRLYCITDRTMCGNEESLVSHVEMLCRLGIRCIQLREKDLSARSLYFVARKLREITKKYATLLFINDRVDIALACDADGVHCREEGIPGHEIRKLSRKLMIGRSIHTLEGARLSVREDADFLVFGPVFEPGSKVFKGIPAGLDALKHICNASPLPVYALGGMLPDRAGACLSAGARGVACISAVMKPDTAEQHIIQFKNELGSL